VSFLTRALGVAERVGNLDQTAFILGNLGSLHIVVGDWSGARDALERGLAQVAEQSTASAATPPCYLGQLALYEGDWDEARRLLEEALAIGLHTGERVVQEEVKAFLAELDILSGRPDEAVRRVEALAAEGSDYHGLVVLAWALLESGKTDEAATRSHRNVREAREAGDLSFLVEALRVHGMVLRRQARFDDAATALREGLQLARSLPNPYAEARLLGELGLVERDTGNGEASRQHLDEALTVFRRLGALRDVERTQRDLGSLSQR
jgi:tetratricopeptide (TPR) repeat protein